MLSAFILCNFISVKLFIVYKISCTVILWHTCQYFADTFGLRTGSKFSDSTATEVIYMGIQLMCLGIFNSFSIKLFSVLFCFVSLFFFFVLQITALKVKENSNLKIQQPDYFLQSDLIQNRTLL